MRKTVFIGLMALASTIFVYSLFIGCNNTKTGNVEPSPFLAPATDTASTVLDSNAYILK